MTEYQDIRPTAPNDVDRLALSHVWMMARDGSAKTGQAVHNQTSTTRLVIKRDRDGWESIGVAIASLAASLTNILYGYGFLAIRRHVSRTIRQTSNTRLQQFRAHAARFAHQLDGLPGLQTVQGGDEWKRLTTYRTLSAMIGVAARRYEAWDAIDPEELIVGGTYGGTLLWKRYEDNYIQTDVKLCGQCGISTFARRFWFHADLEAFRRVWRQGIVYSADRSVTPWAPEIFDVAPGPNEDYYDDLDAAYLSMVKHFDEVSGALDHA